jgi:hydroxymethylglutaryl-CoA reductase
LIGRIELPIAVGIVGGATKVHPLAKLNLKILGVSSAQELACILAAVGLVQNLAAIRAIVTEGIQRGHMELHARSLAIMAGAKPEEASKVAELAVKLAKEKGRKISMDIVEEALRILKAETSANNEN